MLAYLEHVLRTVFRPVGQTELKRWLTELSVHDGLPSILKGGGRQAISRTGTGELDGKDVVLSDSQEVFEDEIDGEARTSLAVVEAAGGGRVRMSRQRPAANMGLELPVPRDAEADLNGRPSEELTALPISETVLSVVRRTRDGGLRQVFAADQAHMHYRLIDLGLSHRSAVLVLYIVSLALAVLALATMQMP